MTALLLALLASCVVAAAAPEVSLTVANHTGFALTGAPVRGGVPFPLGALTDGDSARLVDASGRELACRLRPSAYWHDGSVKWLLVDALVDIPAGGEAMLTLKPGAPSEAPSPRVEIVETEHTLSVHTGAARFEFSRTFFGLPFSAALDVAGRAGPAVINSLPGELVCEVERQPPGPPEEENWLRDAAGGPRERFVSDPAGDYTVEVETANDLHAIVRLSGWLVNESGRRLMQYIIRAHAHAGRPELRVLCTLVYAGNPKEDFIRALYLRAPWSETGTDWALGGSRPYRGRLAEGRSVSLWEIGPDKFYHLVPYTEDKTVRYSVAQGDRHLGDGEEAAGWARVEGPQAAMTVALRDFRQMHPKELAVDPQGLTVYIWPERGGKVLDLRRRSDEIDNVYHYDLSMWEYGGEGVALWQEMLLRFDPPGADLGEQLVAGLNAPLRLLCSPTWYAETLAFGPLAAADPAGIPVQRAAGGCGAPCGGHHPHGGPTGAGGDAVVVPDRLPAHDPVRPGLPAKRRGAPRAVAGSASCPGLRWFGALPHAASRDGSTRGRLRPVRSGGGGAVACVLLILHASGATGSGSAFSAPDGASGFSSPSSGMV